MKYLAGILISVWLLQGCISATTTPQSNLESAETALANADYKKSLELYRLFQKKNRSSKYFLAARLGEALSLEAVENWSDALDIYRSVYDAAVRLQPDIAAQAMYRMSFCYEALGDDVKAVATLKDSLNQKEFLAEEVVLAEAPARLAMLYSKSENISEARKFIDLAQKGMAALQGRRDISRVVLAKASYQMGAVSLNQISIDNLARVIAGQKSVQRYLLKAMGFNVVPWSKQASEKLKRNYRDMWNTLLELPGLKGVDAEVLTRRRLELQTNFGVEYLDLIEDAELFRPLEAEKMNNLEEDFFAYLAEQKKHALDLLHRYEGRMGLTSESEKLNGMKRPGKIKEAITLPKNKSVEDPNL